MGANQPETQPLNLWACIPDHFIDLDVIRQYSSLLTYSEQLKIRNKNPRKKSKQTMKESSKEMKRKKIKGTRNKNVVCSLVFSLVIK